MAINDAIENLNFTQKILQAFETDAESRILQKGDFLLKKGEIETKLHLIEQGAVKLAYPSKTDEKVVRLAYDGSLINSLSSFLNGQPSEFYMEAIRQAKVKSLAKEAIMQIVHQNAQSLQQYTYFLETLLVQQIDRELDLLTDSPSDRLERVLRRSPNLFQHIPLKYIASYLRMQPETLSRIRNS